MWLGDRWVREGSPLMGDSRSPPSGDRDEPEGGHRRPQTTLNYRSRVNGYVTVFLTICG